MFIEILKWTGITLIAIWLAQLIWFFVFFISFIRHPEKYPDIEEENSEEE
jgi:NADH:ubiquinone oxidoreductase subunit H